MTFHAVLFYCNSQFQLYSSPLIFFGDDFYQRTFTFREILLKKLQVLRFFSSSTLKPAVEINRKSKNCVVLKFRFRKGDALSSHVQKNEDEKKQ